MSGICGIVALDGSSPTLAQITALTAPLERRGPEGTRHVLCGPVALGHTLLATTPEALIEILPFTDPSTGCVVTGDVRLDNRDELFLSLGLEQRPASMGDGELVLRAYLEWGEGCVDHLLGDFAFAIWDPRSGRLFCARDHTGMRQLIYYHQSDRLFAFATEPEAVLAHPAVPRRLNETRIADFLLGLEGADFESTFFSGVLRLPPAHSLTVGRDGLSIRRYWTLKPPPILKLGSDDEYADAFLKVFTEAVRCRLRGAQPVGSMLSGGMDSGSIVAVATRLLAAAGAPALKTFSAIAPDPGICRESTTILEVVKLPHLEPLLISPAILEKHGEAILALTSQVDDPFDAHMIMIRTIYQQAREAKVSVVLDGVNGDVALTSETYQARLLRTGSWRLAWREANGEETFAGWGWTRWHSLKASAIRAFTPRWFRWICRRLSPRRPDARLTKAFAKRVCAVRRFDRYWKLNDAMGRNLVEDRCRAMMSVNPVVGRERYDRVAASCAIECRDPFMDIRVLEMSLRLPGPQLHRDGWRKLILRQAMRGLLPDKIIWRLGKEHVGWLFTQKLVELFPRHLHLDPNEIETTEPYVAGIGSLAAGQALAGTDMTWFGFQVVSLDHWLARAAVSGELTRWGDWRRNE